MLLGDLASSMSSHSDLNSSDMDAAPATAQPHPVRTVPAAGTPRVRGHDRSNENNNLLVLPGRRPPAVRRRARRAASGGVAGGWKRRDGGEEGEEAVGEAGGGRWALKGGRRCLSTA